jgi:hypothetical protein
MHSLISPGARLLVASASTKMYRICPAQRYVVLVTNPTVGEGVLGGRNEWESVCMVVCGSILGRSQHKGRMVNPAESVCRESGCIFGRYLVMWNVVKTW